MSVWRSTQVEPQVHDATIAMMIIPSIAPSYVGWWMMMHLGPLGLYDSDSDGDSQVASQPSKQDDQMDIYNAIHDGPPLGGDGVGGLEVFVVAFLAPYNNHITYSYV